MNADDFLKKLNISNADYKYIKKKLRREPNELELWLFSAMYSEHCAYRHSKKYLSKLPRKNAVFSDENAGGVKIGDHALLFKTESHNHPCAVEPFNGAATGIGGILRDVLAMNARPIALADSLHFGVPSFNKTKIIFEGVAEGISSYGNCTGVPTLAGECEFDPSYNENPLVNVTAFGIAKFDKIKTSKALKGKLILLLGSPTMKDGMGGASFASKDLDEKKENRISVQIADPLTEKKLIEAVLEILEHDFAQCCQDCGAAGILSSTSEMAAKGNCGVELFLDKIHLAQKDMAPFEIMLSETQERMMFCTDARHLGSIKKICDKYEIPFSIIGKTTKDKNYTLYYHEQKIAQVPAKLLANAPFVYVKPLKPKTPAPVIKEKPLSTKAVEDFVKNPSFASKNYIYSRYDYSVNARTVQPPQDKGASAVWLYEENCFLGIAPESNARAVSIDPYNAAQHIVLDAAGKLIAAGYEPLGITNCLNFANPDEAHTMYFFTQTIKGMTKALKKLKIPVCSGNVSFYNKSADSTILPTPSICAIGICRDFDKIIRPKFKSNDTLILLGKENGENPGGLYFEGYKHLNKPDYKLENEMKKAIFKTNSQNLLNSCLRVTKGGVFGAIFKGLSQDAQGFKSFENLDEKQLFSEYSQRYLISTQNPQEVSAILKRLPHRVLGEITNDKLDFGSIVLNSSELIDFYQNSLSGVLESC